MRIIQKRIGWTIAVTGLASFIVNVLIFYPGYMSNDSLTHLSQALGVAPMSDLSPLAMTLVWRFLIGVSGHVSSMLLFQLALLWLALVGLASFVYRITAKPGLSLAVLCIGWLPFVVNISGVVWKDNSMTFALLLAIVGALYVSGLKAKRLRGTLLVGCLLLCLYAALVRYNALPAIIPLVFLIFRYSGYTLRLRTQLICTGIFALAAIGAYPTVNAVTHAKADNAAATIMVDDILNVAHEQSEVDELQGSLENTRRCRDERNVLIANFWACASDQDRAAFQHTHYKELSHLWLKTITHHPLSYATYHFQTFAMFIFPTTSMNYYWQDGITVNDLGQTVKFPRFGDAISRYVKNFGFAHFSFLYEPWFWLTVNSLLFARAFKEKRKWLRDYTLILPSSGIIYIIGYLPVGATNDYRYIYWSVFTALLTAVLIVCAKYGSKAKLKQLDARVTYG